MNRREAIATLMALPATVSVSVAKVQPKDVIVFECQDLLSQEGAERIKASAKKVWPDNEILVLGGGLTIKIVKSDA